MPHAATDRRHARARPGRAGHEHHGPAQRRARAGEPVAARLTLHRRRHDPEPQVPVRGGAIDDVGVGDLWNFPAGIPHSIQGLEEGCEFLLVFDDGSFSENETFLISDWFAHTPRDVLARNFGVSERAFDAIPLDFARSRYIFSAALPPELAADAVPSPAGTIPTSFSHRLLQQPPIEAAGGRVRIVDSSNFPAATTIAAALVEVDPGGIRELHWHPNADEWQYYLSGHGRMTVFASAERARTFDYQAGDVGYVPFAMGHYVENTGEEPLRFLEMFRSDRFADVSLAQWMALTPRKLVQAHLNLSDETMDAIARAQRKPIVKAATATRASLPDWPDGTIAMLSTDDGGPHLIPVTAPLRAGDRRIMFSLEHDRGSLARLREHPQVALLVIGEGNVAFTARGTARVVAERLDRAPDFAAIALDVEQIDDHRQPRMVVDSGVGVHWTGAGRSGMLREHLAGLRDLAQTAWS